MVLELMACISTKLHHGVVLSLSQIILLYIVYFLNVLVSVSQNDRTKASLSDRRKARRSSGRKSSRSDRRRTSWSEMMRAG